MFTRLSCMFIIICTLGVAPLSAQLVYYQDMFKGGVTGGGYNPTWNGNMPGEIELYIEPGSETRKALLFVGVYHSADSVREVMVNGNPIVLNSSSGYLCTPFTFWGSQPAPIFLQTLVLDVTETVNISNSGFTTVSIEPPSGQPFISSSEGRYVEYYLLVTYENENMGMVNTFALVNETNSAAEMNYSITNINPIDTSKQIGLAVHGSQFCNDTGDGSFVSIN